MRLVCGHPRRRRAGSVRGRPCPMTRARSRAVAVDARRVRQRITSSIDLARSAPTGARWLSASRRRNAPPWSRPTPTGSALRADPGALPARAAAPSSSPRRRKRRRRIALRARRHHLRARRPAARCARELCRLRRAPRAWRASPRCATGPPGAARAAARCRPRSTSTPASTGSA